MPYINFVRNVFHSQGINYTNSNWC